MLVTRRSVSKPKSGLSASSCLTIFEALPRFCCRSCSTHFWCDQVFHLFCMSAGMETECSKCFPPRSEPPVCGLLELLPPSSQGRP